MFQQAPPTPEVLRTKKHTQLFPMFSLLDLNLILSRSFEVRHMKTYLFLQLLIVVLVIKANNFSICNILMIKTYVTSLELQYLFDNQLVSNCLLVFFIIY
jgi:hypothetical protein